MTNPIPKSGAATHIKRGLRIPDIVETTGLCRSKIYEAIAAGDLKVRKYGRATVALAEDVDAFMHAMPEVRPRLPAA
jgi:predicted DNA-binding transcriptional regulator AlpA